jgi:hypothetical protein
MTQGPMPDRRAAIGRLLALPLACLPPTIVMASQDERGWTPLFNGTSFDGWETFLGRPHRSSDVAGARDERGEYLEPIGVGRDPKGVFSIVTLDGAPAIRVSGEIYGALTTVQEFGDYHLRFEFKWGSRKWPPREQAPRDTECCYHASGPHGASYGFWMQSCEFQIMEGDCGDFYGLAGVIVDVEAVLQDPSNPKSDALYRPGAGPIRGHARRAVRSADHERPQGEWNTLELYCAGQQSLHVVNGRPVMKLFGIRHRSGDREAPLERGRIQLQSEGGEVYFRNLAIRPIDVLPKA